MKAFSFHIDTSAKFDRSGRRIRKSGLDLALQFRLPSLKFETAAKADPDRPARQKPSCFVSSPSEILAVHQSRYGDFMISTMQQRDGSWIAGFGCADGRPLLIDGRSQAVAITNSYSDEALALAEAQLRIDAAVISRSGPRRPFARDHSAKTTA